MDGDSVIIGSNPDWPGPVYDGSASLQDLSVGTQNFAGSAVITVAGSFQWTGGYIADAATINIQGNGTIAGGSLPESPSLSNGSTLNVSGTLTITGPGALSIGAGSNIVNSGIIILDQGGLFWGAGAPPMVTNNGTITVSGSVLLQGSEIKNLGTLSIPAGSELVLTGGAVLHLAGGEVIGNGNLHPSDQQGNYGTVSIEADTVLPAGLTLTLSGAGYVSGLQTAVPPPVPPALQIDGTLALEGGTLYYADIVIGPQAHCTISGSTSGVDSGQVDNRGVITLLPGAAWSLSSGAQVTNGGRLSMQGDNSITVPAGHATMTNAGLIESAGTGTNQIGALPLANTGNIAVHAGTLDLTAGTAVTVTGGSVFVDVTTATLGSSDSSGTLTLSGGTAGGVLRGTGTIGAMVTNGGWIEPAAPGLVFTNDFSQSVGGSLVLPPDAFGSSGQLLVSIKGPSASLGGSLWCRVSGTTGATASLISVSAAPAGKFARVRVADDDTRLVLSYPAAAGVIGGQRVPAPGYYGLDFSAYPAGSKAAAQLQDLFDNTPFSYLGFYFKTTGHPGGSWHGHAQALLAQGWALLPIYVGRQQYWKYSSDNTISADVKTATQQGNTDGSAAVSLAGQEGLPQGSLIFLDIEATAEKHVDKNGDVTYPNVPPGPQTIAYIDAWLSTVGTSHYGAALYDANSTWTANNTSYYEAPVIHGDIRGHPVTWVAYGIFSPPSGITTSNWPLDDNGDVCPIAIRRYSTLPRWDFAEFAAVWQFYLDWAPPTETIITDQGTAYPLSQIVPDVDLNAADDPDPARTSGSRLKKARRAEVAKLTAANASMKPGATTVLTVTLDRTAPAPNGTAVLVRCDSSDVTMPTAARVPPGATSVDVNAAAVVGASAATVTVSSRTLYQLTGAPASATLTISA